MNLTRVLALKSGDVLVAVSCGRAMAMRASGADADIVPYDCGERVYVVRVDVETPEVVRIADGRPLGRVDLRKWEPVTRCDLCLAEHGEHELRECTCSMCVCADCAPGHAEQRCGNGFPGKWKQRRQRTLTYRQPRQAQGRVASKTR